MSKLISLRTGLAHLRRRRQRVRWGMALVALLLALLGTLVIAFAIDWFFDMTRLQRVLIILLSATALYGAYRRFARPWLAIQESDIDMALLVARQHKIDCDLVAALQFEGPEARQWGSTQLRHAVIDYVAEFGKGLNVLEGFSARGLVWRVAVLGVALLAVGLFSAAHGQYVRAFFSRICLGSVRYPTRTVLDQVAVNGQPVDLSSGGTVVRSPYGTLVNVSVLASGDLPEAGKVVVKPRDGRGASTVKLARDADAPLTLPSPPGGEGRVRGVSLQARRQAQESARTMARELVFSVLDMQLTKLEVNGLDKLPIHDEIVLMRKNIDRLIETDMAAVAELLAQAQGLPEAERPKKYAAIREKTRGIVVRLSIERQNLVRRLKLADTAAQIRRLIDLQTTTLRHTETLTANQSAPTLATIQDERDLKAPYGQLHNLVRTVSTWGGAEGAAAADGLRILKAARVAEEIDGALNALEAVKFADAAASAKAVIKGLSALLEKVDEARGLANSAIDSLLREIAQLTKWQQELKHKAKVANLLLYIKVDYPSGAEEWDIARRVTTGKGEKIQPCMTAEEIIALQDLVLRVPVSDQVLGYAWAIVRASRPATPEAPDFVNKWVSWGAGPRGLLTLVSCAKARAILYGRYHATVADVQAIARPALRHRIACNYAAQASTVNSQKVIEMLLEHLPADRKYQKPAA